MPPVPRWSELWLMLDRHFPGDRCEDRSIKIDDLYNELIEHWLDLSFEEDYA